MKHIALSAFALLASTTFVAAADPMDITPLTILSDDVTHEFTVEVADDRDEISFGLMERESMDADKGMLFDFDPPREPAMFMKNTLIPLDMLFINDDGGIKVFFMNIAGSRGGSKSN
ncbi:MAG: DUF192 domain-containing protein, partial [Pseudomonadota bacterium]